MGLCLRLPSTLHVIKEIAPYDILDEEEKSLKNTLYKNR